METPYILNIVQAVFPAGGGGAGALTAPAGGAAGLAGAAGGGEGFSQDYKSLFYQLFQLARHTRPFGALCFGGGVARQVQFLPEPFLHARRQFFQERLRQV
jgi:hypothetical protein